MSNEYKKIIQLPCPDTTHKQYKKQNITVEPHRISHLFFNLLLSTLLLLIIANNVFAQDNIPSDTENIEDMSLTDLMALDVFNAATLLPTEQAKTPGTTYSFNSKDFTRMGIQRLDDLLEFIPGFQVNQHRKRHRSIWVRGLLSQYNDKLVLLVDGIRRQHAYYGHFSLGDNFPLEKIEKVEIILGPASSLYGSNAFGGIISVTTKDFSKDKEISGSGGGGTNTRGKGTLMYNSDSIQVFGSYLSQDAPFRDDRKSFIGRKTTQPLDEEYANLFFKAKLTEGLTVSADYYRNNTPFVFIPSTQNAYIEEENLTLSAAFQAGDVDQGKIQANVYYTWDNVTEFEEVNPNHQQGYKEHQDSIIAGTTITGFKRLFEDHIVALGFNWMHTEATDMDFERRFHFSTGELEPPIKGSLLSDPNASQSDFAFYTQDVWSITPELELTVGGRYDNFEQFGGFFNYRGALVYTPDNHQSWKLMYGTGIRTPTFREYLKVLEGTTFVAPTLDPEHIESLELGYSFHWQNGNINLTVFHNEIEDYIHVIPTPDGADEFFANSETKWRIRGAEGLLNFTLLDDFDLRFSGSYIDAEELSVGKLPYIATWTGSFMLNYNIYQKHYLGFSLVYNSSRQDTNSFSNDNSDEFLITNLFASGEINRNLSYSIGVDNLFDSRVYDPAADFGRQHNTERPGREVWGRLNLSFDL